MGAPKRASDEQVKRAIVEWRGHVSNAADALGIHRNNLAKRLNTMGIDASAIRDRALSATFRNPSTSPQRIGTQRTARNPSAGEAASKNGPAIFSGAGGSSTFPDMQPAAAEVNEPPIPTVRGRQTPTRLKPAQQDRLREAKFDLQARYRVETDENALLQSFFDDAFDAWLRGKLSEGGDR